MAHVTRPAPPRPAPLSGLPTMQQVYFFGVLSNVLNVMLTAALACCLPLSLQYQISIDRQFCSKQILNFPIEQFCVGSGSQ